MQNHKKAIDLVAKAFTDPNKALRAVGYKVLGSVGHSDFKRFIVLSRSRVGSNFLISLLDSHPNIHAEGEIFARLDGRNYRDVFAKAYGKQPHYIKATGFKIFYYHPNDDDSNDLWDTLVGSNDIYVIHLKRRNILRTLVSRKIAESQGAWAAKSSKDLGPSAGKAVTFSETELEEDFRQTREWENNGDTMFENRPLLSVYYEDLAENPDDSLKKVTDLLGLDYVPLKSNLKKQNPERLRDLVTNYDDLKSAFAGTEWQEFFEE